MLETSKWFLIEIKWLKTLYFYVYNIPIYKCYITQYNIYV